MHHIWSAGQESPSGWETCKLCELQPSLHHTAAGGYWWSNVRCGQEASQDGTYQSPASKQHTGLLWRPGRHSGPGSKPLPHRKWIPQMNLHGKLPLKCEYLQKTQATLSDSEWFSIPRENLVNDEMFRLGNAIFFFTFRNLKQRSFIYLLIWPLFVHKAVFIYLCKVSYPLVYPYSSTHHSVHQQDAVHKTSHQVHALNRQSISHVETQWDTCIQ